MSRIKKQKTFDAVKMKRDIQAKIYVETKEMSFEEFKNYITQKIAGSKLKTGGQVSK